MSLFLFNFYLLKHPQEVDYHGESSPFGDCPKFVIFTLWSEVDEVE